MTDVMSIALSGIMAQQKRLYASASNIANALTAGKLPEAGQAASTVYKPMNVALTALNEGGVSAQLSADEKGYSPAYDPSNPYANKDGMVAVPNVDLTTEVVSIIETKVNFKANIAVLKTEKEMTDSLLNIIT